jgi:hypothetical protein
MESPYAAPSGLEFMIFLHQHTKQLGLLEYTTMPGFIANLETDAFRISRIYSVYFLL